MIIRVRSMLSHFRCDPASDPSRAGFRGALFIAMLRTPQPCVPEILRQDNAPLADPVRAT